MNITKIENKYLKESMYVGEHETGLGIFFRKKSRPENRAGHGG